MEAELLLNQMVKANQFGQPPNATLKANKYLTRSQYIFAIPSGIAGIQNPWGGLIPSNYCWTLLVRTSEKGNDGK